MIVPFSLRIFVADGDPDGLRLVERSNWVGKALMFPRALLPQVKLRPELSQTGVYLLLGPREDGEGDMLYVGEGDPIRPRLESHYAQKDFWTRAVCFVATPGQLNKAHAQFLESNLIRLAKAAKRLPLDNANQPMEPSLSEADRADMQVFLDNMLGMLPVLGVHAFEQATKVQAPMAPVLTCKGKGVAATGYEASQGFVVKAGSQAVPEAVPSMQQHVRGMYDLRQELIANGVLAQDVAGYRFTQDYPFSSPSTAAAVVLGRSANGRIEWKDAQGRTLKELQEAEASQ
ncbi:peptide methionine sulfoxide reductase [Hylemonella gracilis str. Niagara R]|uniref:Peptide methionine sulfoxide reductase n=1 Tax=Hylemonella gracilis str. Niagara R TaxID=1458275 RepID=A0A016XGF5_9BURK|nr:GIY-YIG nuclease family protein [Hylemonella gracilis]EYC50926.1 peptide methionine sulfoxide reductase [Hylemonella gracilis str. Niagara R]